MKPRNGITLMEVLVSIFIAAIGLLALLALFPLGALSMSQAIKDSRTAQAAANAAAIAEFQQIRSNSNIVSNQGNLFSGQAVLAGNGWLDLSQQNPPYTGQGYPV